MRMVQIGDSISFVSKLHPIKNKGNPKEFDYKKYMRNERIYYSTFVRNEDIIIGDNTKIKSEIGWEPKIPIKDTLKKMFDYWLNYYRNL